MKNLAIYGVMAWAIAVFSWPVHGEEKLSPLSVSGATTVTTAKAKELFSRKTIFVDVRNDADWQAGRIPGAQHLDLRKNFTEETLAAKVKKEEAVVFYCNGEKCLRSSEAAALAAQWGYSKIFYYRDGFPAWQAAGYPVE